MSRTLKIFFHDNCFDGATSAALFADFYRKTVDAAAEIVLEGVQHRRGDPFADHAIDGDDNACVDFRYSPHPRMTWWFDHHVSAFQPPSLRAHFDADDSGQKFYDPTQRSCSKFAARVLAESYGYDPRAESAVWEELIAWADVIDGAQFESAKVAVDLDDPALHVMTWLEHNRNHARTADLIRLLGHKPLGEIGELPWVAGPLVPILDAHKAHIDLIEQRAVRNGRVVMFDLMEDGIRAHNKFIAYMLFPDIQYTIGLTRGSDQAKISVGSNPWSPHPRRHDIASICERYGGGGHPVVGAITFASDRLDRAREVGELIRRELSE